MSDYRSISDILQKMYAICNNYNNILVSISGGSDSDIMLDMLLKVVSPEKLHFVWFDTGIEYEATKRHLVYLENRYNISIERCKSLVPVASGCREFGLPFLSKYVSQMINVLQNHNFKWEDKPFEVLCSEYSNCITGLKWWCNRYFMENPSYSSSFNIDRYRLLKQFIISNPPDFKISSLCCNGAKKDNAHYLESLRGYDLACVGVRKAEGGIRSINYKGCFDEHELNDTKHFRPIFWLSNEDKKLYEDKYNIIHSDCYRVYGMKRTGCARCPFGKGSFDDNSFQLFEPKLYQATEKIFGKSYVYTMKYYEFRKKFSLTIKDYQ